MRNQYRFTTPSKTLRRPNIRLDNFALVTANLMPFMSKYQTLSDRQPRGTALLVLPSSTTPLRSAYSAIAQALKEQGMTVRFYSAT